MELWGFTCPNCKRAYGGFVNEQGLSVITCPDCKVRFFATKQPREMAFSGFDLAVITQMLLGTDIESAFEVANVPSGIYRDGARYRLMEPGSTTALRREVVDAVTRMFTV